MESTVYLAQDDDPAMVRAYKRARETFKYFWREVAAQRHLARPVLDLACVKVPFVQYLPKQVEPIVEHMWINDVSFNGETIRGRLLNTPKKLTNIAVGKVVSVKPEEISDWLFAIDKRSYGGYTVQQLRSRLPAAEREEHDQEWGLDFGDYNEILVVFEQKEHPENLIEHPAMRDVKDRMVDYLSEHPGVASEVDKKGYTWLHYEAIAGNLTPVEVLLQWGADVNAQTPSGNTALDYALAMRWEHLIPVLMRAHGVK